jgi:hypothetical protein
MMKALFHLSAYFFISQFPAAAAGVPLSDLFGYSIVTDWTVSETDVKNNTYGPYSVSKHFVEKISVSTQGKLFHKREGTIGSGRGQWSYENYHVSTGSNEDMIYDERRGFIARDLMSSVPEKEKTTFARLVVISATRNSQTFVCAVSTSLALKKGENDYIFFSKEIAISSNRLT